MVNRGGRGWGGEGGSGCLTLIGMKAVMIC